MTTIAKTLPVCQTRHVAYSTFSVLQIYRNGRAVLLEYDNPGGILIRGGHHRDVPFSVREIEGKIIREYQFNVCYGDYYVMMSDGVVHAGVGKNLDLAGRGRRLSAMWRMSARQISPAPFSCP